MRTNVNGLASFPAGVTVIAHENNKKEQEKALAAGGRGAPPADHLPTQVITKNKEDLKTDGVKLELLHWANAHTSGDLVVYLPSEKIVFTGDIIAGGEGSDPLIHLEKNGSSEGWITTVKDIVGLNAYQLVPGHGDLLVPGGCQTLPAATTTERRIGTSTEVTVTTYKNKCQQILQKRLADAEAKRAKIKELVAQGKSLDEIRTAVGDPPPPPGGARFPSFTDVVSCESGAIWCR